MGIGQAHGKVILLGEHTVVHGTPAIALPIAELTVTALARHRGRPAPPRDGMAALAATVDAVVGAALRGCGQAGGIARDDVPTVELGRTVPAGRGLGSSAACATAAVRAVADLYGTPLDRDEVYDLVQRSEHRMHGRASGVDARAVAMDGPIWFAGGAARPLTFAGEATFVVADTGVPSRTREAVARVRAMLDADPRRARRLLSRARTLVTAAADELVSGQLNVLGQHMLDFHDLLCQVGVTTPAVDRLVAAALESGAHGAKLTGGGLGGCVLALAGSPGDAGRLRAALRHAGAGATWTVSCGRAS
ncbi:mevalonate kinase [Nonomuraea sp. NPDC050404]|uniref:mevalonate kinase n=1 Tax=Nonomuraea sp. NPDC050404 TaxID=3155783 RepID=UPI00340C9273